MATKETRSLRGRRRGEVLLTRTIHELSVARESAGLSVVSLSAHVGTSKSALSRMFAGELEDVGVIQVARVASVLGYEISLGLHPVGDPVRDRGQIAIGKRFEALLSNKWQVTDETLLPGPGELRAWDKLLRIRESSPPYLVGVDIETRIRDVQALTRRTRGRERDGAVNAILIVLSDSAHNRRLVDELRDSLGASYETPPRAVLRALRSGERLVGSGVVLL